jgi:hypothetical protein
MALGADFRSLRHQVKPSDEFGLPLFALCSMPLG